MPQSAAGTGPPAATGSSPTQAPTRARRLGVVAACLAALGAVVLLALVRLPFLESAPANWDNAQFVLGSINYSVVSHQPHPPGYVLYIGLGSLLNQVTGDAVLSFALISAVSVALATVLFALLARTMGLSRGTQVLVIGGFALSPMLWYYGTVGLTYAPEVALATLVGICAWQTMRTHHPGWLLAGALVLALAGGFRQTGLVLLLPLWLLSAWFVRPRWAVFPALAVLGGVVLAWFIPLLILAGGPEAYFQASRELAEIISSGSNALLQGPRAFGINVLMVLLAGIAALGGGLIVLLAGLATGRRPRLATAPVRVLADLRGVFLATWLVPALTVYTFGHIGQPGYMMLVLPPLFLAAGWAIDGAVRRLDRPAPIIAAGLAGIALFNLAMTTARPWLLDAVDSAPMVAAVRDDIIWQAPQFGMFDTTRDWQTIVEIASQYGPGELLVLTGTDVLSNFRHASYYLPDQYVWAVGAHEGGGKTFAAWQHQSDYSIPGYWTTEPEVVLPPQVRGILIIDSYLADAFNGAFPLSPIATGNGTLVHFIGLPGTPELLFVGERITVTNLPAFVEAGYGDSTIAGEAARLELVRALESQGDGQVAIAD